MRRRAFLASFASTALAGCTSLLVDTRRHYRAGEKVTAPSGRPVLCRANQEPDELVDATLTEPRRHGFDIDDEQTWWLVLTITGPDVDEERLAWARYTDYYGVIEAEFTADRTIILDGYVIDDSHTAVISEMEDGEPMTIELPALEAGEPGKEVGFAQYWPRYTATGTEVRFGDETGEPLAAVSASLDVEDTTLPDPVELFLEDTFTDRSVHIHRDDISVEIPASIDSALL